MRSKAIVLGLAVAVLAGCEKPAAELETSSQEVYSAAIEPEPFLIDPALEVIVDVDPVANEEPVVETHATVRTHRVIKGDTLYALARTYYGNQQHWKNIYEANREQLSSPSALRINQLLVIP